MMCMWKAMSTFYLHCPLLFYVLFIYCILYVTSSAKARKKAHLQILSKLKPLNNVFAGIVAKINYMQVRHYDIW